MGWTLKMGGMVLACPEICLPPSEQGGAQLGCSPDAILALHPCSPTSAIKTYTAPCYWIPSTHRPRCCSG